MSTEEVSHRIREILNKAGHGHFEQIPEAEHFSSEDWENPKAWTESHQE